MIYITSGENCYRIDGAKSNIVQELMSTQEEADTRMLLHEIMLLPSMTLS